MEWRPPSVGSVHDPHAFSDVVGGLVMVDLVDVGVAAGDDDLGVPPTEETEPDFILVGLVGFSFWDWENVPVVLLLLALEDIFRNTSSYGTNSSAVGR